MIRQGRHPGTSRKERSTSTNTKEIAMNQSNRAGKSIKAGAAALALAAVVYVSKTEETIAIPEATAKDMPAVATSEWQYFPAQFVNQGTESQETYIEQF
jgi:hypothetical protein